MAELAITRAILHEINQIPGVFAWENLSTGNVVNGRVVRRHGFQISGTSDIIACVHGFFVALEVKLPVRRSNTSKAQKAFIEKVRRCGGVAEIVCSTTEAREIINGLGNRKK